ncbi:MAG: hypothetical protein WAL47_18755, partial [Pyrinomonadaceae bacterium]
MSTSDGGLPVRRQKREYLSGPTVSTAIFLCLTVMILLVRREQRVVKSKNEAHFWNGIKRHPATPWTISS